MAVLESLDDASNKELFTGLMKFFSELNKHFCGIYTY